jgi:hypothetical protein
LADAGYGVTAIDTCAELLAELRARAGHRAIRCINDDLRHLRRYCEDPLDIVCMGDTLPHLESLEAVELLVEAIAAALYLVTTFRDYASRQLEGVDRFLPVRQDERRILTCFRE